MAAPSLAFFLVLSAASSAGGASDEGVCLKDNAQAGCGVSLVVQQPGKSLLAAADEVRPVFVWRGGSAVPCVVCAPDSRDPRPVRALRPCRAPGLAAQ